MQDIDDIVRKIYLALTRYASSDLNLEATLISWGIDTQSTARTLRNTLKQYSEDSAQPVELREYARQKLEDLPQF